MNMYMILGLVKELTILHHFNQKYLKAILMGTMIFQRMGHFRGRKLFRLNLGMFGELVLASLIRSQSTLLDMCI